MSGKPFPHLFLVAAEQAGGWRANLELVFGRKGDACRLLRNRHRGPLCVQKPFYPEGPDLAHVYLLHPPGGLVSGDELRLTMSLRDGARVLATTPGAGRLYRARVDRSLQRQVNHIEVGAGASCEWFPQETIVFNDAHASLETRIELASGARFLGWEITVLGHHANGLRFDTGSLRQRLRIDLEGRPALIDRLLLDDASRALHGAAAGMQGAPVSALFAAGPLHGTALPETLLDDLRALPRGAQPCLTGLSRCGDFLLARYLGESAEQARHWFIRLWEILRPLLLQRAACAPRIWAT